MTGAQLRALFLDYFRKNSHLVVPSSSLIPHGDPTLLLNTAGMVQFKPYFLGLETPPRRKLASCQKCFRTTDIESVGDPSHCTFFEMLGNFSIGDYFKSEAISLAWTFVKDELGLPTDRLWITIYTDDNEAFDLWKKLEVPASRIVRLGEEDNFWGPPGDAGPCGPCSEIHFDYGPEAGCGQPGCNPGCECGRFVEIWNLVFLQFNQDRSGRRTRLEKPSIDTGMGLERISAVLQGKKTIFETDLFKPLVNEVARAAHATYGQSEQTDMAVRVVSEHGRGISFLVADGVMPGSDGRGYILRRLIRRAALYGRRIGFNEPFLNRIASVTIDIMGGVYPELKDKKVLIHDVIEAEEDRFSETLTYGLELLDQLIEGASSTNRILKGKDIFKLYDTFGFPVELSSEIAIRRGIRVDMAGFEEEMSAQRERAKANQRFKSGREVSRVRLEPTCFTGYKVLEEQTTIRNILVDGQPVDTVAEGQQASLILARSPFYAEKGGQVGDTGFIASPESEFRVNDTVTGQGESIIQIGKVTMGSFSTGDEVSARVDENRRKDIARNHTATHLLHSALRKIIGNHAEQRGSLVSPDRLRFDFSSLKPVPSAEIEQIENLVNEQIRLDLPVRAENMSMEKALSEGAIALFDEKYGNEVRVLTVGSPPISMELCGGTHVSSTGEIGIMHILTESSVGAGIRRIEALTGRVAQHYYQNQAKMLARAGQILDCPPEEISNRLTGILEELDVLKKQAADSERQDILKLVERMAKNASTVGAIKLVTANLGQTRVELLRDAVDYLKSSLGSGIIALGSAPGGKPVFVIGVTDDLISRGYDAGRIVKSVSSRAGGGGGGKPGLATGGGRDAGSIDEALQAVKGIVG